MFERHTIATDGLPFAELKQRALINPPRKPQTTRPISPAVSAKTDPVFRRAEQRHTFHMTACHTQADRVRKDRRVSATTEPL